MTILGAHVQMLSIQCTNFQEKSMHPYLRTCVDNSMSTDGEQTDRQTDRVKPIYPPNFVFGGYNEFSLIFIICTNKDNFQRSSVS